MKHKIEKIIEKQDGRVFTVSRGNVPPVDLPQAAIDHLVAQGYGSSTSRESQNYRSQY